MPINNGQSKMLRQNPQDANPRLVPYSDKDYNYIPNSSGSYTVVKKQLNNNGIL